MAHLSKNLFKEWLDGDIIDAKTYVQERELIRVAINHNDQQIISDKTELENSISDLAGDGRSDETVFQNALDIQRLIVLSDNIPVNPIKNSFWLQKIGDSPNFNLTGAIYIGNASMDNDDDFWMKEE